MRRLLVICCASVFLDSTFFAALAPILPDLREELGLTTGGAGLLAGSYAAGVLVVALPSGWFAARFGPKRALLTGLVGMGAFSTIFGFADSGWLLDSARFMQGASGAMMWVGSMSWVMNAGPVERRGAVVGTLVASATVGELLGAPIGALAHALSMELVFGMVGVVSAILFVSALTLGDAAAEHTQGPRAAIAAARGSHMAPAMWLLASASFAFGLATVLAPLRLDELGASAFAIAAGFAVGSLVETILGPQIGRVSDRIGRARPFRLGAAIGALSIAAIGLLDSQALVFGALVLFSFAAGLAFTPSLALAADAAEQAGVDQGYASGFTNLAWGGGQMLGAFGGGALAVSGYVLPALAGVIVFASAGALAGRIIENEPVLD